MPLTDVQWLDESRQVQRAVYGKSVELIANFRSEPYRIKGAEIAARSVASRDVGAAELRVLTPTAE